MLRTYRRKTANFALYSIQLLVFIREVAIVYRAVRNGSLNKTNYFLSFERVNLGLTYLTAFD
jgi:hypothetical protein